MPECVTCGTREKLIQSPEHSGDKMCKDCAINWYDEEIESLKRERNKLAPPGKCPCCMKRKSAKGDPEGRCGHEDCIPF